MASDKKENQSASLLLFGVIFVMAAALCWWNLGPWLPHDKPLVAGIDIFILGIKDMLKEPLEVKGIIYILIGCSAAIRTGKKNVKESWGRILVETGVGALVFFINPSNGIVFTITTLAGFLLSVDALSKIFRRLKDKAVEPDDEEGFEQNDKLINTADSVNIPYVWIWKGRRHNGWINCINPFRASMVLGSPGSGKSFAIYNAFIEQQIRKGYTMFVYDYKFPDLTERVITEVAYQARHENLWKDMKVKPHLYIINFDDPLKSNRCNPIHHSYITDPADTTEIADLVFKNINKGSDGKGFDFFNESAKVYLDALVWWLANYDPDAVYGDPDDPTLVTGSTTNYVNRGKYCTFPHVIELMAYNYKKTFQILQYTKGLEAKISPFASALEGGAMEQLQGQIASAQIPMGKFVSPALYWVMTGDDFTLDINNPEDPKIVCMGNNPDRQSIYGTTLALYTSRMFKLINHKHKLKSAVLLDEVPTVFIKGLDNLIATARSNKVAIVLGAQDKSQLRRDYGDKESEVIMTTVGNMFSGSVEGRTAEDLSKTFGKEYRRRVSVSKGEDSETQSVSYQLEDILPASRIVDMTQGTFCGWVKDNFGETIRRKKFYGAVTVDGKRNAALKAEEQGVPIITDLFGGDAPVAPAQDRERLEKIHPDLAGNDRKIQELYVRELVQKRVNENFNSVKEDVKWIVEREYERTAPLAEKAKAENGDE